MSYVELHFHLLPGIDDGPKSIEESLELARAAVAEGTRAIVATPHVSSGFPTAVATLPEQVGRVVDRLDRARIRVNVLCGAEVAHDQVQHFAQRELELIAQGPPENRWVLLEAPFTGFDHTFTESADELRARRFAVVVAHPERVLGSAEGGWRIIDHELAAGSALQVNAWSVAGLYGDRVRRNALRLLRRAPRAVIASDAHGPERMPSLRLALDSLTAVGLHNPGRLAGAVPHALLTRGLASRPTALAA